MLKPNFIFLKLNLLLIALLVSHLGFAQGSTERVFTLNLKLASLENFPKVLNEDNSQKLQAVFVNGLNLQVNDNQLTYRVGINLYNLNKDFMNNNAKLEQMAGKLSGYTAQIGVAKNFNYNKFQPYIGFDLGYRYQKFNGNSSNLANNYNSINTKDGGFITPFLGLRYNILPDFGLYVESSLQFLYSYEKAHSRYDDGKFTFNDNRKFDFIANPIQVGMQFSFGGVQ